MKEKVRKVTKYIIDEIVEKPVSMDKFILKLKGIDS